MTRENYLISLIKYNGINYIWGGNNPLVGLDCSGLVYNAHALTLNVGPQYDLTAQGYYDFYSATSVCVLPGSSDLADLAFYGSGPKLVTHVGICLNKSLMLEAAHGDSTTTNEFQAKLKGARVEVNPIMRRKDLIGIFRPFDLKWD
jgi:cell wall-associated NlpC family hydrolase